ncbi:MAG: response regulator [Proteobacteria bacterium]|nr:response regulator [Pseudomonadota bacterium]
MRDVDSQNSAMIGTADTEPARLPRVLIIDDNPTNVLLAKACLKSEQLECLVAPDGERGYEMAVDSPPDLILLDIMLPGLDGFQVCEKLKATAMTKHIPVLMITALQELEDKIRGLRAGAEDFISKPFNRAELQARVRSLLRMKFLQEEQLETERLRARFQMSQEAERLKDAFISIVSHEVKTPLTVMKGYVSLLRTLHRNDGPDEMMTRIVEGLDTSMSELESLLRQLLDLSRMRSGLALLRKAQVSISELLVRLVDGLQATALERNLTLTVEHEPNLLPVRADEEKLTHAFAHLVQNAMSFTPSGGRVSIHAIEVGDAVEVRVCDTGIGISPEHVSRIFDPFYQVAHYMTRKVEGMGIGLSIVKHIIEDHGGRIDVVSEPNQGTTFTVNVPRSAEDVREILRDLREQLLAIQRSQEDPSAAGRLSSEPAAE